MHFSKDNIVELDVLMLFDLSTGQQGIKMHKNAEASMMSAAHKLFDKGFLTLADGGYLTPLGREAAEHAHALHTMLNAHETQQV